MNLIMKQWFDRCLILDIHYGFSTQAYVCIYFHLIVSFCTRFMSKNPLSLVLFRREKGFSPADAADL